MAGYLDDLIKEDNIVQDEAPKQVEQNPAPESFDNAPTGEGGDARANLYGDEFMKRYGRR